MRTFKLLPALFLPILLAACATTQSGGPMADSAEPKRQFDFEETTLDNGLTVISLEDASAPIVAVQVWYEVGSKDENSNRQGFAHMFEHMMFRGTDNVGPEEHFALVRGTGGWCNAFTSFDYTGYVNTLPSNQLDLALWLEVERMLFLNVSEEGFETERNVVKEERRMGLNEPYGTIFERLMPVIFTKHPYQWTPIGKIACLEAAQIGELRHFWDTYYVPSNATLVVVGDATHEEVLSKAQEYFGWIPKLPKPEPVTVEEPPQTEEREVVIPEPLGRVPLARYAYRGVPESHPDSIPLQIMVDILGGGQSSRLYQDLVKERQICQDAYAYFWGLEQDGMFFVGAELAQDGDGDTGPAFAAMEEHIAQLINEGVTEDELAKVKNQMRRGIVTDQLKVYNKANAIGQAVIEHGDAEWLNEQLAAIENVTPEDISRVAQTYCVAERRTKMVVKPDPDFQYDPDAGLNLEAYEPPQRDYLKEGIERPEGFPDSPPMADLLEGLPDVPVVERTLSNGLKVVVVPNDEVPFATAMLGMKYGAWAEDPDTPGVASMTLDMITKGTENYTAAELAETIESNALTLSGSGGMDVSSVTATALADKLPLATELLAEVVLRPTFPESELAILKEQLKNNLAVQSEDPSYMASRGLRQVLYGDHPYSRSSSGELEDVDPITRDHLTAWWNTFARPDTSVLYFAGDVDPEAAFELADDALGDWDADGDAPDIDLPAIPDRNERRIYLVDKPGAVQSQIYSGHVSITRGNPDYHRSRVFTQIFGGGFNSRLNKIIRVERGLTYGARGYFMPSRFSGQFLASTFTKTESTAETVQAIFDVIDSMRTIPPTDDEIGSAKSYLAGSFPEDLETPQDTVGYQWLIEYNDLPEDYLQQALQTYKATTINDIVRIAHEHVHPDEMAVVVVGDASKIRDSLKPLGPVTEIDETGTPVGAMAAAAAGE